MPLATLLLVIFIDMVFRRSGAVAYCKLWSMKRGRAGATPGNPLLTVKDNTSGIVLVQGTAAAVTPAEVRQNSGQGFPKVRCTPATPRGFRTGVRFREIHAGRQFRGGDALRGFEPPAPAFKA